jgi:membrane-bound serine protease (ClpP class)
VIHPVEAATRVWEVSRRAVPGAAFLLLLFAASVSLGQEAGRKDGLFLTVPNSIESKTTEALRSKIVDAVEKQHRHLDIIVFDFNPDSLPAGSSSFGACVELADLIRRLQLGDPKLPRVATYAFVQKAVTKHTVLPVIACGQIIFGPDGSLGDVPREDVDRAPILSAYREQAKYHSSPDLVLRLVKPELALVQIKTPQGKRIISTETRKEWREQGKEVNVVADLLRGLEPGRVLIDAETAREYGLAQQILASRGEVVEALGLTRRSMTEDWLVDRTPVAWRIEMRGAVDAGKLQSLERRIKTAVARNANIIILQLDSDAGDTRDVAHMANKLRTLKDNTGVQPVRLVAWIPPGKSLGAATFLALGCSEILMGRDTALSDFRYLPAEERKTVADMLLPLAKSQGYPPLLFQASLEKELKLARVRAKNDGPAQLIRLTEFDADQKSDMPRWTNLGLILATEPGGLLRITPAMAREFQINSAPDVDTLEALYAAVGVEADKVRVSRDDYLDHVAEFFREPWVNSLLIMLGIIGLILEIKMPGTTIPGTVAAICFVLFFWAYSFVGEFTLLAILLFLLGLVMIGVEVFVVPGITFVGLTGIVLVIGSLGLVTLDRWPTTSADWLNLAQALTTFGLTLVAAVIGAICLTYYLPSIPYANRMVLSPPSDDATGSKAASVPARLLGAIGVALTTLRPAGMAQFGDEFLDVVAEGDYVEPGRRLQIIEIEGNRIVVKEI